jgi:hypothetical protein
VHAQLVRTRPPRVNRTTAPPHAPDPSIPTRCPQRTMIFEKLLIAQPMASSNHYGEAFCHGPHIDNSRPLDPPPHDHPGGQRCRSSGEGSSPPRPIGQRSSSLATMASRPSASPPGCRPSCSTTTRSPGMSCLRAPRCSPKVMWSSVTRSGPHPSCANGSARTTSPKAGFPPTSPSCTRTGATPGRWRGRNFPLVLGRFRDRGR